jgi:4'-phosphopantetheinyl transferase
VTASLHESRAGIKPGYIPASIQQGLGGHLAPLPLPENVVQVWILHDSLVKQTCVSLANTLSPDERQRACAYRQDSARHHFIARRGTLRWLIGRYFACKPESVRFSLGPFGKPALQWPIAPGFAFSISQTHSMALFAFAQDCRVGVDVEQLVDGVDIAGVGREVFSSAEQSAIASSRLGSKNAFFRNWTRKEALLKAIGTGLLGPVKCYTTEDELQTTGGNQWRASYNGVPMRGWTFLDLMPSADVRGALAVSGIKAQVSIHLCA